MNQGEAAQLIRTELKAHGAVLFGTARTTGFEAGAIRTVIVFSDEGPVVPGIFVFRNDQSAREFVRKMMEKHRLRVELSDQHGYGPSSSRRSPPPPPRRRFGDLFR